MTQTGPRCIVLLTAMLIAVAAPGLAQEKDKTVKKAPIAHTSPASGKEMFNSYCAVCHGKDAKGGNCPADYVTNVLRSGVQAPAHGSTDMPVWGPLFASISGNDPAIVNMRISNLVRYLESLQVK